MGASRTELISFFAFGSTAEPNTFLSFPGSAISSRLDIIDSICVQASKVTRM